MAQVRGTSRAFYSLAALQLTAPTWYVGEEIDHYAQKLETVGKEVPDPETERLVD